MTATPRGIKNKNPGNLRYRSEWNWPGVVGIDSKGFAIFESPERGFVALIQQLKRDKKRGLDTFEKLVPKYAPANDNNNVLAYIASLEHQTKIRRDQVYDLDDRRTQELLMRAFCRHEQGPPPGGLTDWYDDATYGRALDTLRPISQSRTIRGAVGAAVSVAASAVTTVATVNAPDLATAHATASAIWPKWAPVITGVVALGFLALIVYSRVSAKREGVR
jgi:hypothetical protein